MTKYAAPSLRKLGFDIISERPLKFKEYPFEIKVNTKGSLNGVPISRYAYVRKFLRIFLVVDADGMHKELMTEVFLN